MNFAKDLGFTNAPGDELGDLRAEVKDEDFLVHDIYGVYIQKNANSYSAWKMPGGDSINPTPVFFRGGDTDDL